MKKTTAALFAAALAAALLCTACIIDPGSGDTTGGKYFDSALYGKWTTSTPTPAGEGYQGSITIGYNSIKIEGFNNKGIYYKIFDGFSRGVSLQAYSEKIATLQDPAYEGKMYIVSQGQWQPGIPFTYYRENEFPNYIYKMKLTFGTGPSPTNLYLEKVTQ